MKKMTATADSERFRNGAAKYAEYLETPEGRLRLGLAFTHLQDFLPPVTPSLRVLDIGCGTGSTAVRLAQLGSHITLLDSSLPMLDLAKSAAKQAGVANRIALIHGDAAQLPDLFDERSFNVILCHNILEYVDDPGAVLHDAARALRDSSAVLSVLVRNRAGEVLKAAIKDGDLATAEHNLTAEWAHESLYGGSVRLFTRDALKAALIPASLAITGERGVRVLSDYLPPTQASADYERIFELECKLGKRSEFARIARYTQYFARREEPVKKDGA